MYSAMCVNFLFILPISVTLIPLIIESFNEKRFLAKVVRIVFLTKLKLKQSFPKPKKHFPASLPIKKYNLQFLRNGLIINLQLRFHFICIF